jgi:hypothetical protein
MTHLLITTGRFGAVAQGGRYLRSLLDPASLERVSVLAVVRPLAAVPFASDFGEEEHAAQQAEDPGGYSFHRAAQEAVERVAEELRGMTPTWRPSSVAARPPTRSSGRGRGRGRPDRHRRPGEGGR